MDNPLWGCFPTDPCYNMDQVPFPFAVNHDRNFTTHDDNDTNISAPSDAQRKRQFTMHVVVTAGAGDKFEGFVDIFCKGTGKIISKTDQDRQNATSKNVFQNNAQVETPVMLNISETFVKHKMELHGADTWVL